jgi:protein dithiol oxidoreductase (disulfide-forming)
MFKHFIAGLVFLFAAASAQSQPVAGTNYQQLASPLPTDTPEKIEVIEFFWYGCPHCYAFEPVLEPWVKKLPKDAQFRRIPAIFNEAWGQAARVYYALEAIGEVSRLHKPLFDAIHASSRLDPANEAAVTEWLGKQGVDTKKFSAAYRSFTVEGKVKRAAQLTQAYKLDGVPSMAVNGKYVVSASASTTREQLINVTDYLIEQSRKELKGTPKK